MTNGINEVTKEAVKVVENNRFKVLNITIPSIDTTKAINYPAGFNLNNTVVIGASYSTETDTNKYTNKIVGDQVNPRVTLKSTSISVYFNRSTSMIGNTENINVQLTLYRYV